MARTASKPRIFTDGERMLISLDGGEPRDAEGKYVRIRAPNPLSGDPLRFSVTRGGTLKFSKKVKTEPKFEERVCTDADGNPVPNESYERDMERYGRSYHKEHATEHVLLEEPDVRLTYEVDRNWWGRHGVTRVTF